MSASQPQSGDPASVAAALPDVHTWHDRPTSADLASLPTGPAVVLWIAADGAAVQLATTQQLKRFANSRLLEPDEEDDAPRARADLAAVVRGVRWRTVSCPFEGRWWYYRLARALHPKDYRRRIGFGSATFLALDRDAEIPDWRTTDRVYRDACDYVGPFPSHAQAQAALDGLRDLFELCRYPEQVRKAPAGKTCAYADMGRCDAPCDGSAPMSAYRERVTASFAFATGGVGAWLRGAQNEMARAAQELEFERAALIKQQIVFADRWQRQWSDSVGNAAEWRMLLVLPVTRRKAWKLFYFDIGVLIEGPIAPDRKLADVVREWLPGACAAANKGHVSPTERTEQAWLVAHLHGHREAMDALLLPIADPRDDAQLAAEIEAWRATRAKPKRTAKTTPSANERPADSPSDDSAASEPPGAPNT